MSSYRQSSVIASNKAFPFYVGYIPNSIARENPFEFKQGLDWPSIMFACFG